MSVPTVVLFENNEPLIKQLKKLDGVTVIPFSQDGEALFSDSDVATFVASLNKKAELLFLINAECNYGKAMRTKLPGIYFFQCLIKEYGSSKKFNYRFYSFLSKEKMIELNPFAIIIENKNFIRLPFNFTTIFMTNGGN